MSPYKKIGIVRVLLITCISALFLTHTPRALGYNVPTNALTAHWSFEGNFNNSFQASGNVVPANFGNLNLVTVNGANFGTGFLGQAAHFDGIDDYLEISKFDPSDDKEIVEDEPINPGSRTISVWFKADQAPLGTERFMVYETAPNFTFSLGLREATDSSKTKIQVYSDFITSADPFLSVELLDSEIAEQWVHVLLTYSITPGSQLVDLGIIVNNDPSASNSGTYSFSTGSRVFDDFHIGTYRSANDRFFPGLIDELAVWERALTELEKEELSTPHIIVTTLADEDDGAGSLNDPADISLREAILYGPAKNLITFTNTLSGQNITLFMGQLNISNNLTIDASALSDGITINGNDSSRIFEIAPDSMVHFDSIGITDGKAPDGTAVNLKGANGGGILNYGSLNLLNCYIFQNTSGAGFPADVLSGMMDGNGGNGGGIYSEFGGTLTLENSTVANNSAGNGANGPVGGAYGGSGGGIYSAGTLSLLNTTLTGNTTGTGEVNDYGGNGGGIYTPAGLITINHSTITQNSANSGISNPGVGGGIYNLSANTVVSTNSIITGNSAISNPNLFGNFAGSNILTNGNPMLAPLGSYVGFTPTLPPLPGSPAIDAGGATSITNDQHGFPRVIGAAVDIGAVEIQPSVVLNTNDSGPGSLREILRYSTSQFPITFTNTLNTPILLTSGQIEIDRSVNIDASAIGGITINGNGSVTSNRIFKVAFGTTTVFDSLTLTNGYAAESFPDNRGGAIFLNSTANLTLNNSTVAGNRANRGGGVYNTGTLTLNGSSLVGNEAGLDGGGIFNNGTLTLNGSSLTGNEAGLDGGGIFNYVTLTLNSSSVAENIASDNGGGIYNDFFAFLTLNSSSVAKNIASDDGGGICNRENLTLNNSTVAKNIAHNGGGIYNDFFAFLSLNNSIVAGNTAPIDGNIKGSFSNQSSITSGAPLLAPLGNYGGPTETMPPLPGSPAIDAGGSTALLTDQRGLARVIGAAADIGSVEIQNAGDTTSIIASAWTTDTDGDGNPFGVEFALGTDWNKADATNSANLVALSTGGAAFGINPNATNQTVWVLSRTLDLVSDPFVEIYRYDGPTDTTTTNVMVSLNTTPSNIEVQDLSNATNAYYRFEAEVSP